MQEKRGEILLTAFHRISYENSPQNHDPGVAVWLEISDLLSNCYNRKKQGKSAVLKNRPKIHVE